MRSSDGPSPTQPPATSAGAPATSPAAGGFKIVSSIIVTPSLDR
jgi:hypothetical protein